MSQDTQTNQQEPEQLLAGFRHTWVHVAVCIVISLVLHVIVVGATSVGYVNDRWVNPEAAKARKAAAAKQSEELNQKNKAVVRAVEPAPAAPTEPKPAEAKTPDDGTEAAPGAKKGSTEREAEELRKKYKGETIKKITEMPKEGEIPDNPQGNDPLGDELGIKFNETSKGEAPRPPPKKETPADQTKDDDGQGPGAGEAAPGTKLE